MAIFGPKPWINPFGKMSIFRVFEPSFFYSLKRCFFVLEYRKRRFPGLYCLKKKLEKWPFLVQNHGLTSLAKYQFFDGLKFLFLYPRKVFFVLEYCKRPFCSLYCPPPPPKKGINGHFWTKSMVLPIWKNVNIHGVNPWFWCKNGPFSNFSF